jgi:hypothetical protein
MAYRSFPIGIYIILILSLAVCLVSNGTTT